MLYVECPIAPPAKPEGYRVEPAKANSNCELCRGGWLRMVGAQSGRALHELPEPAGMWKCFHDNPPPKIHSCHHVEPCVITAWVVGIGLSLSAFIVATWPWLRF